MPACLRSRLGARAGERADAQPCACPSRAPVRVRGRYEKYTKEENRDRLLNPGDAFSEACLDFQSQISSLMEARGAVLLLCALVRAWAGLRVACEPECAGAA